MVWTRRLWGSVGLSGSRNVSFLWGRNKQFWVLLSFCPVRKETHFQVTQCSWSWESTSRVSRQNHQQHVFLLSPWPHAQRGGCNKRSREKDSRWKEIVWRAIRPRCRSRQQGGWVPVFLAGHLLKSLLCWAAGSLHTAPCPAQRPVGRLTHKCSILTVHRTLGVRNTLMFGISSQAVLSGMSVWFYRHPPHLLTPISSAGTISMSSRAL